MYTKNRLYKELILNSLFEGRSTIDENLLNSLGKIKYDNGKYKPQFKDSNPITIHPIWYELRKDKDGPYLQVMTFAESNEIVNKVWHKLQSRWDGIR